MTKDGESRPLYWSRTGLPLISATCAKREMANCISLFAAPQPLLNRSRTRGRSFSKTIFSIKSATSHFALLLRKRAGQGSTWLCLKHQDCWNTCPWRWMQGCWSTRAPGSIMPFLRRTRSLMSSHRKNRLSINSWRARMPSIQQNFVRWTCYPSDIFV